MLGCIEHCFLEGGVDYGRDVKFKSCKARHGLVV